MKIFAITHFPELTKKEVYEILNNEATVHEGVIELSATNEEANLFLQRTQSTKKLLISLGLFDKPSNWQANFDTKWFKSGNTFKIEVEGVKGQENRFALAKEVSSKIIDYCKSEEIELVVDVKEPQLKLILFHNSKQFFLGLDLKEDLSSREYRVFPHSASFKGDLAYYFVRKSGFEKNQKMLVGFMKDGTLAIEATFFVNEKHLREGNRLLGKTEEREKNVESKEKIQQIYCFDEGTRNLTATRKNSTIAKVKEKLNFAKLDLDDLDVRFDKEFFDVAIFHITKKDEDRLNEIYYQLKYVLKQKGKVLFISRENWDPSVSSFLELVEDGTVKRGESVLRYKLMRKK